jgi:SAM-dependent methyltransferase
MEVGFIERICMEEWIQEHFRDITRTHILDVGCGNGHLLFKLARMNYMCLTGIDYSEHAVKLARTIHETLKLQSDLLNHPQLNITFFCVDILQDHPSNMDQFDCVLDKGTFDAISLMEQAVWARHTYVQRLISWMKSSSIFLITSCNWTKEELITLFSPFFSYHSHVSYPEFSYQGGQGSRVSTVAFTLSPPH